MVKRIAMIDEMDVVNRLIDKSQEAFLLAIELYNRPTIRYHAEGCCFFLCNAWELMLKAHISKTLGESAVFYPDSDRSLSLTDCVRRCLPMQMIPFGVTSRLLLSFAIQVRTMLRMSMSYFMVRCCNIALSVMTRS